MFNGSQDIECPVCGEENEITSEQRHHGAIMAIDNGKPVELRCFECSSVMGVVTLSGEFEPA